MEKKAWTRPVLLMLILGVIAGFYLFGGSQFLTLEFLQENLSRLRFHIRESPVLVTSGFVGLYLFLTSLSIPGSILLTLLAGAIFGLSWGTFWVMLSATVGACLSFLMSRYLLRSYFEKKFRRQFQRANLRVEKEGASYLFTLRMIPVSPYVVINIVMGLTEMRLWSFAWVTFLGMLPGTFLYVLAGQKLATIRNISEILTWEIAIGLTILGLLPFLARLLMKRQSRRYVHE